MGKRTKSSFVYVVMSIADVSARRSFHLDSYLGKIKRQSYLVREACKTISSFTE